MTETEDPFVERIKNDFRKSAQSVIEINRDDPNFAEELAAVETSGRKAAEILGYSLTLDVRDHHDDPRAVLVWMMLQPPEPEKSR